MALTDSRPLDTRFVAAPDGVITPRHALARLPHLHDEARRNLSLGLFLSRSPQACIALMASGAAMLLLADGSLKAQFAWAVLVLIGVVAMTRNFIRGFARSLRRLQLEEAAADLRVLLLYTGVAWGGGALLIMPAQPSAALTFTFGVTPALMLAFILKDQKGVAAFTVPAAALTAGAALLGAWPLDVWVALAILAAASGIMIISALQHTARRSPANALALR